MQGGFLITDCVYCFSGFGWRKWGLDAAAEVQQDESIMFKGMHDDLSFAVWGRGMNCLAD